MTGLPISKVFRHKKRKTLYRILWEAKLQCSNDELDNEPVIVYCSLISEDWWVRPKSEFFDGRFEELTPEEVEEEERKRGELRNEKLKKEMV